MLELSFFNYIINVAFREIKKQHINRFKLDVYFYNDSSISFIHTLRLASDFEIVYSSK